MDNLISPIENAPATPRVSGKLTLIFPDGQVKYDGQIGDPADFPLTEAELAEVQGALGA